jgi:hypothetical protein
VPAVFLHNVSFFFLGIAVFLIIADASKYEKRAKNRMSALMFQKEKT